MKAITTYFNWLTTYPKSNLKGDVVAGITVGILLIPQGMAYALIAGLPVVYGLYAAIFPQIMYFFLGSSKRLAVGPVALDSLIAAAGLGALHLNATLYIQAAILLALLVGIMHVLLGIFKLGFLVNFLSKPVISGFTIAAAIAIGFSQLNHVLGTYSFEKNDNFKGFHFYTLWDSVHIPTFLLGFTTLLLLVLFKRMNKNIPSSIVVVILGLLVSYFFNLQGMGISIIEYIPSGLPSFQYPQLSYELVVKLIPTAITIAIISYTEAISIGKVIEAKHEENELKPNRELIALGFSNIIGAFFQSYPVTGGLSRTIVNDDSGANSKVASLISAFTVIIVLVFFTPLFYYLPKAVLGAIIIVSVVGLLNFSYAIELFKNKKDEFLVWLVSFVFSLFMGMKQGLFFGVILSLLLMVYRTSKPHIAVLGKVKGTPYFKNITRFSEQIEIQNSILILRFDAQIYFGNATFFRKQILKVLEAHHCLVDTIILNAESISHIDSSGIYMLKSLIKELRKKGIRLVVSSAIGPIRDIFNKTGLLYEIGCDNLFIDTLAAYEFLTKKKLQTDLQSKISLQSNKKNKL